jgi:hypothetical protein
MGATSVPSRELLAAASRQRRDVELDDLDDVPARVAPGKQSAEQRAEQPAPPTTPGKLSRWDAGRVDLTPAEALDFSALLLDRAPRGPNAPQIDRRAEQDGDVDEGALAAAFTFIEESRAGQPLPEELRRRLADELGAELTQVRVHTDDRAARAAGALRARAFTIGDDIYFAAGAYDPTSEGGIELIAHEVTHVVQQRAGHASGPPRRVSHAGDRQEQEADAFSRRFAGRHGRPGAEPAGPAEAAARMRAEAARAIPAPFLDELEHHFGTAFADARAQTGEAARLAVQLMAAGATAVGKVVALADPSPRREQLLHELSQVARLGQAAAPAWAAVTRAPVAPAPVTAAAEPGVIHRDPAPTTPSTPESTDVAQQPQTLELRTERVRAYLDSLTERAQSDETKPVFVNPEDTTFYYRRTSAAAFTLEEYRHWVKGQPGWGNLTDAQLATDLTSVHAASDPRLVRCGAAGRKWGRIAPDEPHPGVVALHDEAVAGTRSSVGDRYKVYCDALVHCVSLTPRPTAAFRSSPAMNVTWSTDSGPQPVTEGDLSLAREAIRTAVTTCTAYQLANGEWRQFFTEIVNAPQKFPQKMVGDMFEELAAADLTRAGYNATRVGVVFAQDPAIPELTTQQEYIGDGVSIEGASLRVMEMKTGPANPGAVGDDGEVSDGGMLAKAAAYAAIIKNGVHATNIKGVSQRGPFTQCVYVFVTQEMAAIWAPRLRTVFEGQGVADSLVVYPDPETEGVATITFNPTFQVALGDTSTTSHHLTNPAIVHPGVLFHSIDVVTTAPGSTEIASGTVTMDVDLAGGVQGQNLTKPITPEAGGGRVENQLDGLQSSLGSVFSRIEPSARLVDDGVEASIRILAGDSGIPNINLEESVITATYTTSGELSITGDVRLAHTNGKITGQVQVAWAAGQWSFTGSATVAEGMIDGLSGFTATVTYDGGQWSFGVDRVSYEKQIGAVTLNGTALGLMYDVEAGAFSGQVELDADLGMFGHAGASATIANNELTNATLSYDSPEFKYPSASESPAFRGTVGGTVTYENGQFSGAIRGTANVAVPALQAIAGESGIGLAVNAQINADGTYGGTVATTTPLQFGQHLEIPSLSCTIEPDGSMSGAFEIKVVKIKYLEEARIACTVDAAGVHIADASVSAAFGEQGTGKFWGTLRAGYSEAAGLSIGGDVNYQIKEGMIATGTLTYDSEANAVSLEMTVSEIKLLDSTVSKQLFSATKQIPVFSVWGLGVYLDLGFDLGFDFGFDLGVRPTVGFEGLSLETFEFTRIQAELELLGNIYAQLTGTPRLGLGIFALSPSILRGGGGVRIPIVGRAEIRPTGTISVAYTPDGGVDGDASVGMAMTFGITGSVTPYAELSVLDGMFNPSWQGDALTSFEILPPKEIFNFTIDLAGDMTTQTPELPESNAAGEPTAPEATTVLPETHAAPTEQSGPAASAEAEGPTAPVAETGDEGPFSLAALAPLLEALPGAATVKGILEKAGQAWDALAGAFGRVINAFKSFFSGLADQIMEILDGFATQGLGYIPTLVRKIVGETVYEIIEPLVLYVSQTGEELLELFETDPPTDLGNLMPWVWQVVKRVFGLAAGSLGGFVNAIRQMFSNLGEVARRLVTQAVTDGWIGVKRHHYYIWNPFDNWDFMAAAEFKLNIPGVLDLGHHGPPGILLTPGAAVAIGLYELLEEMGVPVTYQGWNNAVGEAYNDRWRGAGARG